MCFASIIIPVYNTDKKYLKKCIQSVQNQSYNNIEIIVVDDGSTNDCAKYCDELCINDNRCKVIHTENRGVSFARNIGLDNASGIYVAFVDSDDWVEVDYVERLSKYLDNCDIVIGTRNIFYESRQSYENSNNFSEQVKINDRNLLLKSAMGIGQYADKLMLNAVWAKLYRLDIVKKYNIRFDCELKRMEDVLFNLEYIIKSESGVCFVDRNCYIYRNNIGSTINKFDENLGEKLVKPLDKIKAFFESNGLMSDFTDDFAIRVFKSFMIYINDYVFCSRNYKSKSAKIKEIKKFLHNDSVKFGVVNLKLYELNMSGKFWGILMKKGYVRLLYLLFNIKKDFN